MNKLNHVKPVPRRFLLELGAGAAIFGLIGTFSQAVKASLIENKDRGGWRFCTKCGVLFSLISNTICAAGGKHSQVGSLFYRLPTSKFFPQPTATLQLNWGECKNCGALFYLGRQDEMVAGKCPLVIPSIQGKHVRNRDRPIFSIPHNVPETARDQANWRFCTKCSAMFYDGFPSKGVCAAGGSHQAKATDFNYVLPHSPFPSS